MIVYDLSCKRAHQFEGWFNSRDDFEHQKEHGLLVCPVCGDENIHKLPSPSRLNLKRGTESATSPETPQGHQPPVSGTDTQVMLEKIRNYIYTHYEDVGARFAEEAKKIHYGETEARNIRGQATAEEVGALVEEGIEALPLPAEFANDKKKLN